MDNRVGVVNVGHYVGATVGSEGELPLVTRKVLGEAWVTTPRPAPEGESEGDVTAEALAYLGVGRWEERDEEEKEREVVEAHGFGCVRDRVKKWRRLNDRLVVLRRQCGKYNLGSVV